MRIENRLKREAKKSCVWRKHKITPFVTLQKVNPPRTNCYIARSVCIHCGKYVQIETRPAPNAIDIGGTAVALNCND